MTTVREPAVAGTFYPNDAATFRALISNYLDGEAGLDRPKTIIAPHAGYIYSGAIYGTWHLTEVSKQNVYKWSLADKQTLLQLARKAIRSSLEGEKSFNPDLNLFPEQLKRERATFVTLNIAGKLRGCIDSLQAHRPLVLEVSKNVQAAAFQDTRFSPLSHEEFQQMDTHISILTQPRRLPASQEDLVSKLQPRIDSLIIKEGAHQATYLPSAWQHILDPRQFIAELRVKAALDAQGWQNTEVFTYSAEEFY